MTPKTAPNCFEVNDNSVVYLMWYEYIIAIASFYGVDLSSKKNKRWWQQSIFEIRYCYNGNGLYTGF